MEEYKNWSSMSLRISVTGFHRVLQRDRRRPPKKQSRPNDRETWRFKQLESTRWMDEDPEPLLHERYRPLIPYFGRVIKWLRRCTTCVCFLCGTKRESYRLVSIWWPCGHELHRCGCTAKLYLRRRDTRARIGDGGVVQLATRQHEPFAIPFRDQRLSVTESHPLTCHWADNQRAAGLHTWI